MAVQRHGGGRGGQRRAGGAPPSLNRNGSPPRGIKQQGANHGMQPHGMPPRGRSNPAPPPPRPRGRYGRNAHSASPRAMHNPPPRAMHNPPRHRRRGRNYTYYYILLFIFFAIVFIVLANTVLFKCASFEVEGAARYSAEEIIGASGIKKGDNLLHINAQNAQSAVESTLAYIDSAEVKKRFPTKIRISVVEAEKWFLVEGDDGSAVVSRGGKIIDNKSDSSLVKVKGYEAGTLEVGTRLSSEVEGKNGIPEAILEAADKAELNGITEIDLTDRFAITVNYQNRIVLELGNITDVEKKLNVAAGVIETQISDTEEVLLNLIDPDVVVCRALNADSAVNELPEIPTQTAESTQSPESAESAESE